jgi:monothiol glutaredoxin
MENIIFDRIKKEIATDDVVLFMKGTPVFPQCGFSAAVAQILGVLGVTYHSIDVLQDSDMRQGIKDFANWPTIPQLYIKNEFVGGCDIIREMYEAGELQQLLNDKNIDTNTAS